MNNKYKLPAEYIESMREVPGIDPDAFLEIYDEAPVKALRFNTRKARPETIERLIKEWSLEPVPWCKDAYYYEESDTLRPGLSPYHDAGVYYIQEPSAMITAEKADISPEDIVLDLCAAPGGKSTQAAAKARWMISNEPIPNRARILSSNIERMGFDNCIVSSAYPDELARAFCDYFDKIIVDAPCSGEGMMRKDETAVREWSPANVAQCIARQREILDAAAGMLKEGGRLIYSTCTFEYGENDGQITDFIQRHGDYRLIESETMYPHMIKGEGHYCAVLERCGYIQDTAGTGYDIGEVTDAQGDGDVTAAQSDGGVTAAQSDGNVTAAQPHTENDVCKDTSGSLDTYAPMSSSGCMQVYAEKHSRKSLPRADKVKSLAELSAYMRKNKLHVLRTGVEPGETITDRRGGKRYEPSHAEALSGYFGSIDSDSINLTEESDAISYLKGNVIELDKLPDAAYILNSDGGWLTVMYDGYPLGLGKLTGRVIKNHYPKGLRHV